MDEGSAGRTPFWCRILLGQAHPSCGDAPSCLLQEGTPGPGNNFQINSRLKFKSFFVQVHNIGVDTVGTGIMGKLGNKVA